MKTLAIIVFVPVVIGFFVSCAPKDHYAKKKQPVTGQVAPVPTATPIPEPPTACQIAQSYLNENNAFKDRNDQTIHIERHYQRVIRKDCTGAVTSDQEETVVSPTMDFELAAPRREKFKAVFVFNENSCDHRLTSMPVSGLLTMTRLYSVFGDGQKRLKIQGDLSGGHFNFRLRKGINKIFVQYFYDCYPSDVPGNKNVSVGQKTCVKSKDSLIVGYTVNVTYEEKHLNEIREVVETKCQQPETKKK